MQENNSGCFFSEHSVLQQNWRLHPIQENRRLWKNTMTRHKTNDRMRYPRQDND